MLGKPDVAQRLCGSLQVNIEKPRRLLGWTPLLSLDEGFRRGNYLIIYETAVDRLTTWVNPDGIELFRL